jgi:hypothetical protein
MICTAQPNEEEGFSTDPVDLILDSSDKKYHVVFISSSRIRPPPAATVLSF